VPTYDYECEHCGHRFEAFQSITAAPIRECPACGRRKVVRLIGSGAGVLFRGSGFHQTDYRSESYKKAAEAESKSAEPKDKSDASGGKEPSPGAPGASGASEPAKASAPPAQGDTPAADARRAPKKPRGRRPGA
jgi:putative FmdB family regulatory protein